MDAVLALQVEHGLDPLTTAGWDSAASWRDAATRCPGRLVKAVVTGPITSDASTDTVRATLLALAEAGCTWIEVHEPAATMIDDDAGRSRFAAAHRALTAGLDGVHLSLALVGGSAEALGIDALLAGAYASLAVDLIDGPDNWRLVAGWPGDRGVVVGALPTPAGGDERPEMLLWAAAYAASTGGRGGDRVGLAPAGSLAGLSWEVAARKVSRLGEAARLATASLNEIRNTVDPRALDHRSAALGRSSPRPSRPPRTTIDP